MFIFSQKRIMEKHWSGFLNAVSSKKIPETSKVAPYPTTDSSTGTSGFMDVAQRTKPISKKYDAMTPSWGGISASNKEANVFKSGASPVD
jgi:hypothetical protein